MKYIQKFTEEEKKIFMAAFELSNYILIIQPAYLAFLKNEGSISKEDHDKLLSYLNKENFTEDDKIIYKSLLEAAKKKNTDSL